MICKNNFNLGTPDANYIDLNIQETPNTDVYIQNIVLYKLHHQIQAKQSIIH